MSKFDSGIYPIWPDKIHNGMLGMLQMYISAEEEFRRSRMRYIRWGQELYGFDPISITMMPVITIRDSQCLILI